MDAREIPEQWKSLLDRHRVSSARDLARGADVGPTTASKLLQGEPSSAKTIRKVAAFLKVTPERIRELRGEIPLAPFRLPEDADKLTARQRQAVLAIVRAMIDPGPDHGLAEVAEAQAEAKALAEMSQVVPIVRPTPEPPASPE